MIPELGQSGVDRPPLRGIGVDRPLFEESHGVCQKKHEKTFAHFLRDECVIPLLIIFFLTIINKNRFIVTQRVIRELGQKEAESARNPWK